MLAVASQLGGSSLGRVKRLLFQPSDVTLSRVTGGEARAKARLLPLESLQPLGNGKCQATGRGGNQAGLREVDLEGPFDTIAGDILQNRMDVEVITTRCEW
jgi:hypothetical protein